MHFIQELFHLTVVVIVSWFLEVNRACFSDWCGVVRRLRLAVEGRIARIRLMVGRVPAVVGFPVFMLIGVVVFIYVVITVHLGLSFFLSTYSLPLPLLLYYGCHPFAPCNSFELDLPSDTKARTRCLASCAPSPIYYTPPPHPYCTTYTHISTY